MIPGEKRRLFFDFLTWKKSLTTTIKPRVRIVRSTMACLSVAGLHAVARMSTCGTDTTLSWYNCKDEPGTKICMSCYKQNQLDVAAAAGTTCVKCGTDTTSQWYDCKDKPGTKICMSCYNKNRRKKKAAASPNEQ